MQLEDHINFETDVTYGFPSLQSTNGKASLLWMRKQPREKKNKPICLNKIYNEEFTSLKL